MASIAVARRTLSFAAARAHVLGAVRMLPPESVALLAARGRALRTPVVAPHDLPPFRNSSMDGYGVRAADLAHASTSAPVTLPVTDVIAAGNAAEHALGPGSSVRIMTGAAIPPGADAVVPFEDTESGASDAEARFTRPVAAGAHLRDAGADLRAGDPVFAAGRELSAHDLALIAALGFPTIAVGTRPTVAILSTGDELLEVGEALRPGAIRDSNTTMLQLLLEEAGCVVTRVERLSDDPAIVIERMRAAFSKADVTITIGGISMGDFDPVKQSLAQLGGIEWWRVAMKPGQPQAFGTPGGRLYFGLPGNPASVACVFEAIVRPALRALQGFEVLDRPKLEVRAAKAIESRAGRTDFVRVELVWNDGAWWATPAGVQVSGHLTPQSRAHALLVVPEATDSLAAGATAEAWVLRWPHASNA